MISLFLFYPLSIFIPFGIKPSNAHDVNSISEIADVKKTSDFTVVFIADLNNPDIENFKDQFLRVATFFVKNGTFLCIDSSKCQDILSKYGQVPPCLVLYKKTIEWMIIPFPRREESLLFLLDHFFSQKIMVVNNNADILSSLGHFDFALLAPPNLNKQVLSLRYQASLYLGNLDIIICDKALLKENFQIKEGEIGIYRTEDRTIKSVKPTFDDVFEGSIPSFRHFVTSDFREPNSTFFAFLGLNSEYEQGLSTFSNDIDDLLFNLSIKFPEFVIGYLEPKLHYIARHATLHNFNVLPAMVAFSTNDRSYFPYDGNKLFQLPFSKNKWMKDSEYYLTQIIKGKIKRKYHSESIPKKNRSDPVEKIVGSTYDSFLRDKKHDLYVMFIDSNSGSSDDALNEFRKAAKIAKDIRFGVIDTILNSSPREFPHIYKLPYVRFYPSKNRSNGVPFLHNMNSDNFLRFAMKFGSKNYKFDVPKKTIYELRIEMSQFSKIIGRLPFEDQVKMEPYFKELVYTIGARSKPSGDDL